MIVINGTRRRIAAFVTGVLVATSIAALGSVSPTTTAGAEAVVGSQFDPGNIISDAYFFDSNGMSQSQIQSFLDAKIGTCQNALCLNVLRVTSGTQGPSYTSAGNMICNSYVGGVDELASAVIFKIQQACRVSAKVILVTLQKEQSLVTRNAPTARQLERAMGYGCPDNTGGTCATQYYGFFNQVMSGAWQLRRYGTAPASGGYQPGVRNIKWNPNDACGSSAVTIQNRATAALYNYTPYQPNAAALSNLYGSGDGCSSYGNRNFWVYYNDWFGSSTLPAGSPEGTVSVTTAPQAITVKGWAVDPDAVTASVAVAVQVDSSWYGITANVPGTNLNTSYPGAGSSHDFTATIPASLGTHTVCVYMVNAGGAGGQGTMGCQQVVVPESPTPVGVIQNATASGRNVSISGWAVQPDQLSTPVNIAINYGSQWIPMTNNLPNTAAPVKVSGAGPNQGFAGTFRAEPGVQSFCVWASRVSGSAVKVACRSLLVPDVDLTLAKITSATGVGSTAQISGWAVWPDSVGQSVPVALNVGSSWYPFTADQPNASAEVAVPGSGPNHGFTASVNLPAGTHNVCVWVAQLSSAAKMVGCRGVTVSAAAPTQGAIETATGDGSSISVSGWAVWPSNLAANVPIAANVGNNWYALPSNLTNAAADAAVPGAGPNHGFAGIVPAPNGATTICLWAGSPVGSATPLGCETVKPTRPTGAVGELMSVTGAVGGVHFEGWAVQADAPTTPVPLAINVGASWISLTTDEPSEIAPEKFSGAGPNQGVSGLVPLPQGTHEICLWAASPAGASNLGCRVATVGVAPAVAGAITKTTATAGSIAVEGWSVWPSALNSPVSVAANVGSTWVALTPGPSTVAPDWVAGAGPDQGLSGSIAAPSGKQNLCLWAMSPSGVAVALECRAVTVP